MKPGSWVFYGTNKRTARTRLLADATAKLGESHARVLAHLLADDTGLLVSAYPPGSLGPLRNPTLVHHGRERAASWHVVWAANGAGMADLYTPAPALAKRITQAIADIFDARMILLDNLEEPARLEDHRAQRFAPAGRRKNPHPEPAPGQIWTALDGSRCRVLAVRGGRVQVVCLESGNREWMQLTEFLATRRPAGARANPEWRELHRWHNAIAGLFVTLTRAPGGGLWLDYGEAGEPDAGGLLSVQNQRTASAFAHEWIAGRGLAAALTAARKHGLIPYLPRPKRNPRGAAPWRFQGRGARGRRVTVTVEREPVPGTPVQASSLGGFGQLHYATTTAEPGVGVVLVTGRNGLEGWAVLPMPTKAAALAEYRRMSGATPNPDGLEGMRAQHAHLLESAERERRAGHPDLANAFVRAAHSLEGRMQRASSHPTVGGLPWSGPLVGRVPNPKGRKLAVGESVIYAGRAWWYEREESTHTLARGNEEMRYDEPANVVRVGKFGRYLVRSARDGRFAWADGSRLERPLANPRGRKAPSVLYDALGNGIAVGSVLIGTGLDNAGRAYTVLDIKKFRTLLEPHLGGRPFWTVPRHYRVDTTTNPRRNPTWRIEATVRSVGRRRRKPAPLALVPAAPVAAPVVTPAEPEATAPAEYGRRNYQVGERVSVPYSGRSSYFGRKVRKTHEKGTVSGYVTQDGIPMVRVTVRRGRQVEDHLFPEDQVRRVPVRGGRDRAERQAALQARLERKVKGDPARATELLAQAEHEFTTADARAHEIYPQAGEKPSREYVNLRAKMRRLEDRIKVLRSLGYQLGAEPEPWARAAGNPRRPVTARAALADLLRSAGFNALAGEVLEGADPLKAIDTALPLAGRHRPYLERARRLLVGFKSVHGSYPNPLPRWVDKRSIRTVSRGGARVLVGCPKGKFHPRARGRRKCGVGTRAVEVIKNPHGSAAMRRGLDAYRMWHDNEPHRLSRVKVPAQPPRVLVRLGDIHSIVYGSSKWAGKPDNPKGRKLLYEHKTKTPRPVLAFDPLGGDLRIVGGRMKPTADGLVN